MTSALPADFEPDALDQSPETPETEAATKNLVFAAAERLFAVHGFQKVSVRDITFQYRINEALQA